MLGLREIMKKNTETLVDVQLGWRKNTIGDNKYYKRTQGTIIYKKSPKKTTHEDEENRNDYRDYFSFRFMIIFSAILLLYTQERHPTHAKKKTSEITSQIS